MMGLFAVGEKYTIIVNRFPTFDQCDTYIWVIDRAISVEYAEHTDRSNYGWEVF